MDKGTHTNIWWLGCYIIKMVYFIYFPSIEDPQADIKESFLVGHSFTSVAYTSDDVKYYDSLTTYDSTAIQCILDNSENALRQVSSPLVVLINFHIQLET